jgi:acyl-CoA reductase-like NAD-dependent aldehyde dehydrogenase
LVKLVESYKLGNGAEVGVTHGPLQNEMQYTRVKTLFDDIKKQGWSAVIGGEVEPSSGYFIRPTIIGRPPENSRILVEEPFGKPLPTYFILAESALTAATGYRPHCTSPLMER